MSSLLRAAEFEIVGEAADGLMGLAEAVRLKPDVILLDVRMPGMSGMKALPGLRDRLPSAAMIVLITEEDPGRSG